MHQQPLTRARVYRDFLGACRGSLTAPAPGLPATGQPSGSTLTSKGSEPADWAASSGSLHHPRRLAPPGGPGRRKRLGVRRAPAREARSEPGRVATLTSPSTVTSLRNPVRARGGAARARPARGGVEGRATSTSRRAPRRHAADGAATSPRSKQIHCHRREFPIARPITNVPREPEGRGLGDPTGGLKNTKGCGAGRILAALPKTLHTIGRYSC